MIDNAIVQTVHELMQSGFELEASQLVPSARLKEDLGLDSLDAVDMLVHLEEKFGTRIEGERLMQVKTLADVYVLVEEAQSGAQALAPEGQTQTGELLT